MDSVFWRRYHGFESFHLREHMSWKGYTQFCTLLGWRSFWGNFDRCDKWLPMRVYTCLYALHGATLLGFGLLCGVADGVATGWPRFWQWRLWR